MMALNLVTIKKYLSFVFVRLTYFCDQHTEQSPRLSIAFDKPERSDHCLQHNTHLQVYLRLFKMYICILNNSNRYKIKINLNNIQVYF